MSEKQSLQEKLISVEIEIRHLQEKLEWMENTENQFSDRFKSLSADIFKENSATFLELASHKLERLHENTKLTVEQKHQAIDAILKPIKETLEKVGESNQQLKTDMTATHASVMEHLKGLAEAQSILRNETSNLVKALRMPHVRGRWGEMQLRRVVELAGMVEHCDFIEQGTSLDSSEKRLRPDMLITLAGGKTLVIDAKTPLNAYLDALETQEESVKEEKLKQHAHQLKQHVIQLSSKAYWDCLEATPEFVVLFLPGETFFSAALEQDPSLMEYAMEKRVVLATPINLIALLRSAAYGWQQEKIAQSAHEISLLGKELYERLHTLTGHFNEMGKGLKKTVESYNSAIGSFESRVLYSARELKKTGIKTAKEIGNIKPVEQNVRELSSQLH
ncbi:MAG: DNA recombination protein RmuC [Chlamydiales bacterium]